MTTTNLHHIFSFLTAILFFFSLVLSLEDDIRCLQGFKTSIIDPQQQLNSWRFTNTTDASFSKFVGVTSWTTRVIGLQLSSLKLKGEVPDSLRLCEVLQILDLSNNSFFGTIPSSICDWFPYLVVLDLSRNNLSGPIPPNLGYCKYLSNINLSNNRLSGLIPYQLSHFTHLQTLSLANNNLSGPIPPQLSTCKNLTFLNLGNNHLSGPIPKEFSSLPFLTTLYVANNNLSGQIPLFLSNFSCFDFEGNPGLYGLPLGSKSCKVTKKRNINYKIILAAGVSGAAISLLLGFIVWWKFYGCAKKKTETVRDDDRIWIEQLRAHGDVEVSFFSEPLEMIKLADLMTATDNFDPENMTISTRIGISYKAVLRDGSALSIKRLRNCKLSEKKFYSEMYRLEQLSHPNLVPLLGFCVVEDEKLLVYKHMPNGSLYPLLHGNGNISIGQLDWQKRLKIGIGMARGLAWLHHGCEQPFVHQNLCSNVVLLDEELDARITDFGLAKLVSFDNENMSMAGEFEMFGYVTPEYTSRMVDSLKGDVYAFGMVLLELATGRKPFDERNAERDFGGDLVQWIIWLSDSGRIMDAIDKSLLGKGQDDEILHFLKTACGCVVSKPKDRTTMDQVYHSLKTIGDGYGFSEQFDDFV